MYSPASLAVFVLAMLSSTSANPVVVPSTTTEGPSKVMREEVLVPEFEMTIGVGIDHSSTFSLNITNTTGLDKRSQEPDQCWSFVYGLGITRAAYISNLAQLRQGFLNEGSGNHYYPPLSTVTWSIGNKNAKLTVRNQDSCYGNTMLYSTHAYYIQQIQDFCTDESGWIHRNGYRDIIFIAEPNGVAPPAYSPRCNYY